MCAVYGSKNKKVGTTITESCTEGVQHHLHRIQMCENRSNIFLHYKSNRLTFTNLILAEYVTNIF